MTSSSHWRPAQKILVSLRGNFRHFLWPPLASKHFLWPPLASKHFLWPPLASKHFLWPHLVSKHFLWPPLASMTSPLPWPLNNHSAGLSVQVTCPGLCAPVTRRSHWRPRVSLCFRPTSRHCSSARTTNRYSAASTSVRNTSSLLNVELHKKKIVFIFSFEHSFYDEC